ncbi:cutinase family protein [Nocardia sp. SYP-A9097]|uniref:cutinase family protein n=1 Tax=Nocardia sp. SYP-A9097 TaxID=2663237 RepID=UPI00189160E9|nr:cutinase family protein [Nocardia sp. SYP-A9097]
MPIDRSCPVLFVFGVQGTDEGPSDAASTTDTGALGQFFTPLLAQSGNAVQRAYVRYGYAEDSTEVPYQQAVADAADLLGKDASEVIQRCPATRIAAAGYGQGAAAVSAFAHTVGTSTSPVNPDKVAGIALFANPTRADNSVLPGRAGQTTPAAAPGTSGTAVSQITLTNTGTGGSGIASNTAVDYGSLAGRVADFCTPGDLSCSSSSDTPLTTTVKNIAAQSDTKDPITAISTIAQALAATVWKTTVGVVTEDLSGTSLDQLSYEPTKTLGQRLAEASDPSTQTPGFSDALSVLFRLGAIGLNTVVSIAQKVFTTSTISELATVGMVDPVAALATLGTKIVGAVADLIPPQTALGWVDQAFTAITSTVTNDSDLYNLATYTRYSDTAGRHDSYTTASADSTGTAPLAAAAAWFAALARDIAATNPATSLPQSAIPDTTPASSGAMTSPPLSSYRASVSATTEPSPTGTSTPAP